MLDGLAVSANEIHRALDRPAAVGSPAPSSHHQHVRGCPAARRSRRHSRDTASTGKPPLTTATAPAAHPM
ncbi:hypothetical protein PUR57_01620 [Streptomyces sp. JV176]|uniref:hypothetical protein n=1 Tax=unclassified Streptomyces TaxID=2593676 RepID=UPI002E79CBFB|nr:hypothetical protein [Streptomyces sp. JV176]MEE1797399.1 hypothetical protein [Streptomyces sp. JV176]